MHQRARATRVRYRQGCVGSQARGPGGHRRALARGRRSPGLGAEPVLAKAGNRDALPALDRGKAMWPSLRQAVYDGAFTAERYRTWSNLHGMRHRIVERDPAAKGFVVVARRWVVERSFGWLAHWNGLARDRAGRLDVSAGRLALIAILSGVEALINPMLIHQTAA